MLRVLLKRLLLTDIFTCIKHNDLFFYLFIYSITFLFSSYKKIKCIDTTSNNTQKKKNHLHVSKYKKNNRKMLSSALRTLVKKTCIVKIS